MADPVYPLVNGNRYSWASIEIVINGLRFRGFKEISYSNGLEPGEMRGQGVQKLGRTRGELKPEASITIFLQEYMLLIAALAPTGEGYLETEFDITVSYSDRNQPIITDTLVGCRLKKPDRSASQGTDALAVKCDLDLMFVKENGLSPIVDPLGV